MDPALAKTAATRKRRLAWLTLFFCLVTSQLLAQGLDVKSELTLGIAACGKGNYGDAIGHLERVVRLDPQSAAGHFYLAEAYDNVYSQGCDLPCAANERRQKRAIEELNRAFELDPSIIEALKVIAWRYDRSGKRDEADRYYRKALKVDPNDFEALYNLAVLNWRRSYELRQKMRADFKLASRRPLVDSLVCGRVRTANLARVEESITLLQRTDPIHESYDLQAYLGLLYRERADIQCGDQSGYDQDINTALKWARRACHTRHDPQRIAISCTLPRCPMPAPPPLPPGEPGACLD